MAPLGNEGRTGQPELKGQMDRAPTALRKKNCPTRPPFQSHKRKKPRAKVGEAGERKKISWSTRKGKKERRKLKKLPKVGSKGSVRGSGGTWPKKKPNSKINHGQVNHPETERTLFGRKGGTKLQRDVPVGTKGGLKNTYH